MTDYLDYYILYLPGGEVEVDEENMLRVETSIEGAKALDDNGKEYVKPNMVPIVDLFGSDTKIRVDQILMIGHWTVEWRDNYRAMEAAKKEADPDAKPFD